MAAVMTLWMVVSDDKYELPVAVADTVEELARMRGVSRASISSMISKHEHGKRKKCLYRRVEIDDE